MHFLLPLAIAVTALLPTDAASAGTRKPTVKVSPSIVAPGGMATVTGKRWKPNAKATVLAGPPHSGAVKLGTVRTDSAGRFRATLTFSLSAKVGRYVLVACQRQCRVKASTKFRIARTVGKSAAAKCGYVDVPGGRAWKIRATHIRCHSARSLAKRCLRGTAPGEWKVSYNPRTDRTTLSSGRKRVSFTLVGGGGCIPG